MKTIIILISAWLFWGCNLGAQPQWNVNPNNFQYSMTLTGVIWFDETESEDPADMVAAFFGEEVRGTAACQYVESLGRYYVFMTIYSNTVQGDSLYFRIYNAAEDAVYTTAFEYVFLTDDNIGSPNLPIIFAYPALNSETGIVSFSLPGQVAPAVIDQASHSITLEVGDEVLLAGLVAEFELSYGAAAMVNDLWQESGVTQNNFSSPVTYRVIAQNGWDEQLWTVTVTGGIVSGIETFGSPDAIQIYPNPAQEVLYLDVSEELSDRQLSYSLIDASGTTVLKNRVSTGNGGNIIFMDRLLPGVYFLRVTDGKNAISRKIVKAE